MRRVHTVWVVALVACAPGRDQSDTTNTLAAVDTMKPATVMAAPDTTAVRVDSTKRVTPTAGRTKSPTTTKTKTTVARDTAHLGRDSVIMSNPRDPRRQIPTVPPKKPLQ